MKRIAAAVSLAAVALVPMAHAASKPAKPNYTISIDSKALHAQSVPENAAWLAYAAARMKVLTDRADAGKPSPAGDDFEVELEGRRMLAVMAHANEAKGETGNAYFSTLEKIADAGFLKEYVLFWFLRPGWTIPQSYVTAFDIAGYKAWLAANPIGDNHPTFAFTETPNGKRYLDVPGQTLTDPASFKMDHASCPATRKAAVTALEAWAKTAADLPGQPLAADSSNEFRAELAAIQHQGVDAKGLTWVSARPAVLAYAAGYCAVEWGDLAGAAEHLRLAVGLRPLWTHAQMELVQVLILQKKQAEAEGIVDHVLDIATDRCDLAIAYRKRGYIRIDQGRLEDSRAAYLKSLELEPGNEIAESELKVIDVELQKLGNQKPGDAYTPPPAGELQVRPPCK